MEPLDDAMTTFGLASTTTFIASTTAPGALSTAPDASTTAPGATLEAILAENGLSKWYATLADEEIDLETTGKLTDVQLEKLGLPMGARVKILAGTLWREATVYGP